MLDIPNLLLLIHPFLAVAFFFPLLGVAVYFAWQTRQRRLAVSAQEKTKIVAGVGQEHAKVGRWLSAAVVTLVLIGLVHPIFKTIVSNNVWAENPFRVVFVLLIFVFTMVAFGFLWKARQPLWRGVFASLTGMGLWILGMQPGVFRRGYEWYVSHFYFGMVAAMLMIFSLAILPEIYQSKRWRLTHVALNSVALLLFIGQAMTGVRDLLEIPPQ
jgi:hypothetical protein